MKTILTTVLLLTGFCSARAAEWQWSVPVESVVSGENNDHPRAFLWIPPNCQKVRAVVLGQHNMEEEPVLEHPKFRAALSELGFAEVWVTPGIDLGFNDGKLVEQNPKLHAQVRLRFLPLEDGVSFKLTGTFLDTVPEGRPEWWSGLPKGSPVAHGTGPITIHRVCSPIVQTGPDTWAIRFYRMGLNNKKRSNEIWLFASHPGDDEYKRSVQQAMLTIPMRNNAGKEQHITFPEIETDLKLRATSDAGVPVYYYVREGPAEIENNQLTLTSLPPRSRMPVKITVVAWQYGNAKWKTADPVERTFSIGTGPAADVSPVWAKATESIRVIEAARAQQAADTAPNSISVKICKAKEMQPTDLAGAVARVGHWNNLKDLKKRTSTVLSNVVDKTGATVPGLMIMVTGGNAGATFDGDGDSNDARLFAGAFDQFDGEPTVVEVAGIPYARYDVYCYRGDDGDQRPGMFTIGDKELTARGGKGNPNSDGTRYVNGGNYVVFENLTGSPLKASFTATFAGDKVQRSKVAGFQIVERK